MEACDGVADGSDANEPPAPPPPPPALTGGPIAGGRGAGALGSIGEAQTPSGAGPGGSGGMPDACACACGAACD